MSATVLSVASRALVDACERLGLPGEPLLAAAGVSLDSVRDPEARLPTDRVDALRRAACEASGDPALALHASEALQPGDYRVLHYLAARSHTVGKAYRRILPYFALVDRRIRVTAHQEVDDRLWYLRFRVPGNLVVPRPPAEFTVAAFCLQGRAVTRIAWAPARVDLPLARPPEAAEHRRVFEAPVRFGRPHTQLCLHRGTWETALPSADGVLVEILEHHAAGLLLLPRWVEHRTPGDGPRARRGGHRTRHGDELSRLGTNRRARPRVFCCNRPTGLAQLVSHGGIRLAA